MGYFFIRQPWPVSPVTFGLWSQLLKVKSGHFLLSPRGTVSKEEY